MKTRSKVIVGSVAAGAVTAGVAAGFAGLLVGRRVLRGFREWAGHDLRGKTVLITGSSRGLGLALAEEFARHGCKLVLCARNADELERAGLQVQALGAPVVTVVCDVSRPEDVDRLADSAQQAFGQIDILVNNAGIISVGPLLSQQVEDFRQAMDVMFWGTVHPTLAVLPQMIARGTGRIVNITSIGGKVSVPHLLPYGCAKFAAVGFSQGLHAELKRFGVHVLTVVPGLMRSGSHLNAQFKGKHEEEYRWFALSGTNPLFSISVERAARQIVDATRRNRAELIVSWQAKLLATIHGVAPGLTAEAMAAVNRVLPDASNGSHEKRSGKESETALTRSPLTALGRKAARRFNEIKDTA